MAGASLKTEAGMEKLDQLLATRSYVGSELSASLEDFKVYEALSGKDHHNFANVHRWFKHLTTLKAKFPHKQWPVGTKLQLDGAAPATKGQQAPVPKAAAQKKPEQKEAAPKKQTEPKGKEPAKASAPAAGGGTAPKDEDDEAAAKVQLLVGKITKVWVHPDSEKLYCEEIDCGEGAVRQIGSGLQPFHTIEELDGRMVVVVANLKPKKLAGFPSNGMVLCASNAAHDDVKCVDVPPGAQIGERVVFGDLAMDEAAAPNLCEKKKLFTKAQPHFNTKGGIAMYKDMPLRVSTGECTAPVADGYSLS